MIARFTGLRFPKYSRLRRMLPRAIESGLAVASALLIWQTAYPYFKPRDAAPAPLPVIPAKAPMSLNLTPLIQAHLFGVVPAKSATHVVPPPPDIHVLGLITSDTPGLSSAIVADNDSPHIMHVGDRLPDGSTLVAIAANAITLRSGNNTTLVPFDLHPAPTDAQFATLDMTRSTTDEASQIGVVPATNHTRDAASIQDTQGQLKALRTRALQQLLQRTRHVPVQPATPSS